MKFRMQLTQLIKVLTPFAKAIACLESSQSNPADVYLFWLAIMSTLKRLFEDETNGIDESDASQIRAIAVTRFRQLLEEGPDDCYISAFYLDPSGSSFCFHSEIEFHIIPGYVHSNVLRKLNPLALTIKIPGSSKSAAAKSTDPRPSRIVHDRVCRYLRKLVEAEWKTKQHPILSKFTRKQVQEKFSREFESYSFLRYPFDKPLVEGQTVRSWWKELIQNPDASVLAVSKLFSSHLI
jgi:hypothetical protein